MLKPKIKQPHPPEYCDLLQAVQWLAYGWEPVPYEFMDILGREITLDNSEEIKESKKALLLLFKTGELKPVGLRLVVEKPLSSGAQNPVLKRIAALNLDLYEKSIKGFEKIPLEFWRAKAINWENSWCWEFRFHDEVKEVPVYMPCPPPLGKALADQPKTQFKNVRTAYLETVYTEIHIPTKEIFEALSDDSQRDSYQTKSYFSSEADNGDEGTGERRNDVAKERKNGRPSIRPEILKKYQELKIAGNFLIPEKGDTKKICSLAEVVRIIKKWAEREHGDDAPKSTEAYRRILKGAHDKYKVEFSDAPTNNPPKNKKSAEKIK